MAIDKRAHISSMDTVRPCRRGARSFWLRTPRRRDCPAPLIEAGCNAPVTCVRVLFWRGSDCLCVDAWMPRGGSTWESRRTRLCAPLYSPEVHRAVSALSEFVARHDAVPRLLQRQLPREACEERNLGALLDCAFSILWHNQSVPRNTFVEQLCRRAVPELRELSQHALSERDFTSLSTLQHGATGTVEVVRCKFDRHLYVLKSILKGVARRESYRFSPVFESQLLGYASDEPYTPKLHAAFQGPGSVHIVMEYFPAGDLDSLLRAAAEAGSGYPGKSTEGGLLQEDWVVRYAADMVAAIGWLHRLQFVHRYVERLTQRRQAEQLSLAQLGAPQTVRLCDLRALCAVWRGTARASILYTAPSGHL